MTAVVVYDTDFDPIAVVDLTQAQAHYLGVQGVVRLPVPEELEPMEVCGANAIPDGKTFQVVELHKVPLSNGKYLTTTTALADLVQKLPSALLPGQDKYFRRKEEWEL